MSEETTDINRNANEGLSLFSGMSMYENRFLNILNMNFCSKFKVIFYSVKENIYFLILIHIINNFINNFINNLINNLLIILLINKIFNRFFFLQNYI